MREIILRAPKAAVDIQERRGRRLGAGQPHFQKLVGIGAIGDALIRLGLRLAEDVLRGKV